MHDIDVALYEAEAEAEAYGETEAESYDEWEYGEGEHNEGLFSEHALAGELLSVTTEAELDRFLGDLLKSAVSGVRDFARSDTGKAVGGMLKSTAKQVLPRLGQLAGDAVLPGGSGAALGKRAGQWVGGQLEFGLQTEGLSAEDQEYETARAFVRFAEETARRASDGAAAAPPRIAAGQAATAAAARHLPGLALGGPPRSGQPAAEGHWVRRGHRIVVIGA